jgi:segregation and condensation protein A
MERKKPISRRIPKDKFTVKDKIIYIRTVVKDKEEVDFESLFAGDATVPEIVTTFQALLELLKHQFVLVEQSELFAKITIKKNPNKGEEEEIGEIDEYN